MRPRPPLLCVHGAGGGGWEWNLWRGVFAAAGFAVNTPDLQPVAAGLAATRFADYQAQVVAAAKDLSQPVLVGASLGGLLALGAAAQVDCSALVLVNPLPPLPEARDWTTDVPDGPIVPWGRRARLDSTRRAMRGADDAAAIHAFRRWRDESAAVLRQARAGITVAPPRAPCLVVASHDDAEVPAAHSAALALRLGASLLRLPGDHLEPLLGRSAARTAVQAVEWLNALAEFRTD